MLIHRLNSMIPADFAQVGSAVNGSPSCCPILQMSKLRLREAQQPAQGNCSNLKGQDLNLCPPAPGSARHP
jgi:hypothetical protein